MPSYDDSADCACLRDGTAVIREVVNLFRKASTTGTAKQAGCLASIIEDSIREMNSKFLLSNNFDTSLHLC